MKKGKSVIMKFNSFQALIFFIETFVVKAFFIMLAVIFFL